jgi:hypothetical protein
VVGLRRVRSAGLTTVALAAASGVVSTTVAPRAVSVGRARCRAAPLSGRVAGGEAATNVATGVLRHVATLPPRVGAAPVAARVEGR